MRLRYTTQVEVAEIKVPERDYVLECMTVNSLPPPTCEFCDTLLSGKNCLELRIDDKVIAKICRRHRDVLHLEKAYIKDGTL